MRITTTQSTPNPDALKLMLDEPQTQGIRSYRAPCTSSATPPPESDPLARALLSIKGVAGVLIHERFITLSRAPGKDWKPIVKAAKQVVRQVDSDQAQHTAMTEPTHGDA